MSVRHRMDFGGIQDTSTPAAHSASCFCKQEAVEQAGMQIISFLPFTFSYLIFFPLTFMQGLAVLNISSA